MPTSLAVRRLFTPLVLLLAIGCAPVVAPPLAATPTVQSEEPTPRKVEFLVFSAKWCSVCRDVPPVLAKLKTTFPDVTVRELDVDEEEGRKLSVEYDVEALPYYFVRIDGNVVSRRKGFLPYDHATKFLREALTQDAPTSGRK